MEDVTSYAMTKKIRVKTYNCFLIWFLLNMSDELEKKKKLGLF